MHPNSTGDRRNRHRGTGIERAARDCRESPPSVGPGRLRGVVDGGSSVRGAQCADQPERRQRRRRAGAIRIGGAIDERARLGARAANHPGDLDEDTDQSMSDGPMSATVKSKHGR